VVLEKASDVRNLLPALSTLHEAEIELHSISLKHFIKREISTCYIMGVGWEGH
jgi:hypothetical protein